MYVSSREEPKVNTNINCTLSIVTITFNAESEIETTLKSVLEQTAQINNIKIEYIIQDGQSTDCTLKIVQQYSELMLQKGIDFRVISEKDSGIYDAMNKGISHTTGKWICLLNAGDTFSDDNALYSLSSYLINSKADVLYSDYYRTNKFLNRKVIIPELCNLRKNMIFCHQALFVRNEIYKKEKYNCRYRLVADYDLMLRLYLEEYHFEHVANALINYDIEGISAKNMVQTYKEIFKVRKDNNVLDNFLLEYIVFYLGIIKRVVLANMPQGLRWKLYRVVKRAKLK